VFRVSPTVAAALLHGSLNLIVGQAFGVGCPLLLTPGLLSGRIVQQLSNIRFNDPVAYIAIEPFPSFVENQRGADCYCMLLHQVKVFGELGVCLAAINLRLNGVDRQSKLFGNAKLYLAVRNIRQFCKKASRNAQVAFSNTFSAFGTIPLISSS